MRLDPGVVTDPIGGLVAYVQNGLEVLRFGGLNTGEEPAPFEVVERRPMYKLRRYFPAERVAGSCPPMLLVPPLMLAAGVWDISSSSSAVTALHDTGIEPWVVDFGSPDREAGGSDRTLTDHVVAVSEIVDLIRERTGRDVHLGGYSQAGMFCYQAAAYRRAKNVASVVTFGGPADFTGAVPAGLQNEVLANTADFVADRVLNRLTVPRWAVRTGFQALDPLKTFRAQFDFLRQLHNRDALLGRERQRRFMGGEGFVAWSGPAVVELLRQFIVQNRMMTGGFAVGDRVVGLADITCPILAVVGEVDEIAPPETVRGISRAAPNAEVFEFCVRSGHFGLVVGSTAFKLTWPKVAEWVHWREGTGDEPEDLRIIGAHEGAHRSSTKQRTGYGLTELADIGLEASRGLLRGAGRAARTSREIGSKAVQTLPQLFRLGKIEADTRVSLGKLLDEQRRKSPDGACFLFEDRLHTNAQVNKRIDNVVRGLIELGIQHGDHVGVLMETRPSALVAIAALSRLGAVAVLLPPVSDLSTALRLGNVSDIIVDPQNAGVAAATDARLLVLGGGGEDRDLQTELGVDVIDMEQIDPSSVALPGWYRPNPGLGSDLAFIMFSRAGGQTEAKLITNHRWAVSAFGTASAAALTARDTVYCVTPLHHPSALLTSVGGAVAGGARIALSHGCEPRRFDEEVHRYGVTVVSYTWTMLRDLVARPERHGGDPVRPIRLFMGSGMPRGLWQRTTERFAPAQVLEFYASTEGDTVLANISGTKAGAKGRPIPGSAEIALAAFDPMASKLIKDANGFAARCGPGEVGLLLTNPHTGIYTNTPMLRGVFQAGDSWVATDDLFLRDADGDFWLMDNRHTVVRSATGPVFAQPICNALADLDQVDLSVAYAVRSGGCELTVAAVTLWGTGELRTSDVSTALSVLHRDQRPDIVHVVEKIPLSTWYRPDAATLREEGIPLASDRAWHYDRDVDAYVPLTADARDPLSTGG